MSEYAKNIQTIEDMWKKRIELRDRGGGRMREYIIDWDENLVIDTFSKNSLREEVVRCRDCKHMHRVRNWLGMDVDECWLHADTESGALGKEPTETDGFCAWAERREP